MSETIGISGLLPDSDVGRRQVNKTIIEYTFLAIAFLVITLLVPDDETTFGILAALPAVFLLSFIFYTKRILEGLTLASLLAFLMAHKLDFFTPMSDTLTEVLTDSNTQWLFIVCGLMGSIIALVERAGGAAAFGDWVSKRAKTKKSTLMWTWLLGIVIFIDDYLNSLTVGSCMAPITDKYKVSREKLAYIVDSTAAPVCVLIPISTWAVYIASLLEQAGAAPAGEGIKFFIQTIPYNIYGWVAVLIVPLVILEIIPVFGPMKEADRRAKEDGILAPPGSEKIDIHSGEPVPKPKNPRIFNFFLPIAFLICSTIYFDIDMQLGVLSTVGFMFLLYIPQGLMGPEDFFDTCISGIKQMLFPLLMVVLALTFANVNEKIGFLAYVIDTAKVYMTPALLPFVVFIVLGITEFIMGLSWGMYAIAVPVVIPLAIAVGADPVVAIGAVCSAGVWGSHICFYSDATILSSAATGCDNYRHALTQMPYGFLGAAITSIVFLIIGYMGL
ncbi:MAG: sodium:proton antiporter [Desulfotalea sp.]|nr:MAG: sodium:proton antiporter [Desulfotalea sp.]